LRALAGVLARRPDGAKRSDRRCEVGDVARRAARLSWTGSARRDAAIHVEIDETFFVACDAHDLAQVLSNVLDNAVHAVRDAARFGCVTVNAARVADREAVEIVVKDDGVGIDPHRLQRIFDPHETTRDDGAVGVGLAVARALVESLGGSIRALSEPGRGTTMIVEVPEAK
jgi:signal transduction histidine kinase